MSWPVPFDPMRTGGDIRGDADIFAEYRKPEQWVESQPTEGAIGFVGPSGRAFHAGIVLSGGFLHTQRGIGPLHDDLSLWVNRKSVEWMTWAE